MDFPDARVSVAAGMNGPMTEPTKRDPLDPTGEASLASILNRLQNLYGYLGELGDAAEHIGNHAYGERGSDVAHPRAGSDTAVTGAVQMIHETISLIERRAGILGGSIGRLRSLL